jgi:triacylglycerol lipase
MKAGLMAATLAAALLAPFAQAANTAPIVFVHGFIGWGPTEMGGYKYWGGLNDIVSSAAAAAPVSCTSAGGCQTFTAVIGPVSSNWDRAVELFYQIKGGCVDYGHHHSNNILPVNSSTGLPDNNAPKQSHYQILDGLNGHPSKCYPGFYPQWDANHPLHFIGHSQGGQTIRQLSYLLRNGSPHDVAEEPGLSSSPNTNPFTGGKSGWIKSVTTVDTPHNGTTLASVVQLTQVAQQLIGAVAAAGSVTGANNIYSFKLDQWGLTQNSGESFSSYMGRVMASSAWTNTTDISEWDLSPDGAVIQNNNDAIDPNVYYFSYAGQQTYATPYVPFISPGYWLPDAWLTPIFQPQATAMGAYTRNQSGHVYIDGNWWQNDGVVNTNSETAPTTGHAQSWVNYTGTPQKGVWQFMGVLPWDHMDAVGTLCETNDWAHCDPRSMYNSLAQGLWSLN